MVENKTDGDWEEWRNLVLSEIRRFSALQIAAAAERKQISTDISSMKQIIAELKVKTDIRSAAIAGAVSTVGLFAMFVLDKLIP